MISKVGTDHDIILITAEPYEDHPLSPVGVIARVLDAKGYKVGIIEGPKTGKDFTRLGRPRLFFGITSGSVDAMVNNYTPMKRKRDQDPHSRVTPMPDRAVTVYCNGIKRAFKGSVMVIGGIEASLRRFAHYDYWDNNIRRSILMDSRADILVYGNGEKQVMEIAERLDAGKDLMDIEGTCIRSRELPSDFEVLPSFSEVRDDKVAFCKMQAAFSNDKDLAQGYDNNYVLQFRYPRYTTKDLDWIYSLGFTRSSRDGALSRMARFSVVTHRGCIGRCGFCSLALHQGDRIISRSQKKIIAEIKALTDHPNFKGFIDDLGGPSANMYGMDCDTSCSKGCLDCKDLRRDHSRIITLMKKARSVAGVKKVFVRSGVRYDLALESKRYIKDLSEHHISGVLKIAPEHFSPKVLKLMNKDNSRFDEFVDLFNSMNEETGQTLCYYLMIGHPGDDEVQVKALKEKAIGLANVEQFQLFTPTPMSVSSCMYWTGMDPFTLEKVHVVHDYKTKKVLKRLMLDSVEKAHRPDPGRRPREGRRKGGK